MMAGGKAAKMKQQPSYSPLTKPAGSTSLCAKVICKLHPRVYNVLWRDIEEGKRDSVSLSLLSVTIPSPITVQVLLALVYSYIPFAMFFVFFTWFVISETVFPLFGTVLLILISLACEAILKNIFREPRPPESAVESYGMPSSHCMTSYAILVWVLADAATGTLPPFSKLCWMAVYILLLAPVPWGRYVLGDHSAGQCIAGCAGGIVSGLVAYVLWRHLFFPSSPANPLAPRFPL